MSDEKNEVKVRIKGEDATPPALDHATKGVRSWTQEIKHHISDFATDIRTKLVEAFGIERLLEKSIELVKDFFTESIERAGESERAWSQLSNTLGNVGINLEHVRPQLDEAVKSLQRVANVRTDDAIAGLNTLVRISSDYRGSLANLTLVADVAAAKHIEFAQAAEMVGRVMAGTGSRALKQFGITTKDTTEALEELRAKTRGASETELKTFQGQVEANRLAFRDFQEEVGDVITGNSVLRDSMQKTGASFRDATKWVEAHATQLRYWVAFVVATIEAMKTSIVSGVRFTLAQVQVIGGAVGSVILAVIGGALAAFNAVPHAINAMVEAANHIPGVHITARMPSLDKVVDTLSDRSIELARTVAQGASTMKSALGDVAGAWASITDKAEQATNVEVEGSDRRKTGLAGEAADLEELEKGYKKRIETLRAAGEAGKEYREQALAGLILMEHAVEAQLKNTNLALDDRLRLLGRLKDIHGAEKALGMEIDPKLHAPEWMDPVQQHWAAATIRDLGPKLPTSTDLEHDVGREAFAEHRLGERGGNPLFNLSQQQRAVAESFGPSLGDRLAGAFDKAAKKIGDATTQTKSLGDLLGDLVSGPISAFGSATENAMAALVDGSGKAGAAFRSTMLHALADVARMEGNYFAAKALGAGADAATGNPLGLAARLMYGLAATAMYALAGAAGGLASGSGGGGGGGYGRGYSTGQSVQDATAGAGKTTVVVQGSKLFFDANDPDSVRQFKDFVQQVAGTREVEFLFQGG